jgi:uncharacterized membrane protein YhaH (DUF805 family)
MSKPVFEDLFRLSGRRNRKSYFLYCLAYMLALVTLWGVIGALAIGGDTDADLTGVGLALVILGALLTLVLIVSSWAVGAQRCRDFGWTGWALLIVLLPFIGWIFGFAMFFVPGTLGPNRYGPDPLEPPPPAPQ